jgi:hypothetical protein
MSKLTFGKWTFLRLTIYPTIHYAYFAKEENDKEKSLETSAQFAAESVHFDLETKTLPGHPKHQVKTIT